MSLALPAPIASVLNTKPKQYAAAAVLAYVVYKKVIKKGKLF